jgi:hypothetical protein
MLQLLAIGVAADYVDQKHWAAYCLLGDFADGCCFMICYWGKSGEGVVLSLPPSGQMASSCTIR